MQKDYPIPASSLEREIEIKKSRFIARVTAVSSREDAMAFLAQARLDYPDARHHCWAYQIGRPGAATQAAMTVIRQVPPESPFLMSFNTRTWVTSWWWLFATLAE